MLLAGDGLGLPLALIRHGIGGRDTVLVGVWKRRVAPFQPLANGVLGDRFARHVPTSHELPSAVASRSRRVQVGTIRNTRCGVQRSALVPPMFEIRSNALDAEITAVDLLIQLRQALAEFRDGRGQGHGQLPDVRQRPGEGGLEAGLERVLPRRGVAMLSSTLLQLFAARLVLARSFHQVDQRRQHQLGRHFLQPLPHRVHVRLQTGPLRQQIAA